MRAVVRYVVARGPKGWRRFDCEDTDRAEVAFANELQCGVLRFQLAKKHQADFLVELLNGATYESVLLRARRKL